MTDGFEKGRLLRKWTVTHPRQGRQWSVVDSDPLPTVAVQGPCPRDDVLPNCGQSIGTDVVRQLVLIIEECSRMPVCPFPWGRRWCGRPARVECPTGGGG